MSDLTREQFAAAVSASLSSVHHLYREITRLITGLKEQLDESPDSLLLFGGTAVRSGRDQGRLVVRNEYALLFKPSSSDEEDLEDEDDEADDGDEEETPSPKRKRQPAVLTSSDQFLGVIVSIYDAQAPESFEPHLTYGVMTSWSVGDKALTPGSKLTLARYMVRRIPKALSRVGLTPGDRVQTAATVKSAQGVKKVSDRRLSCIVPYGVKTIPLYDLDSAAALQRAADGMKEMCRKRQTR